jgi:hypothetical protein
LQVEQDKIRDAEAHEVRRLEEARERLGRQEPVNHYILERVLAHAGDEYDSSSGQAMLDYLPFALQLAFQITANISASAEDIRLRYSNRINLLSEALLVLAMIALFSTPEAPIPGQLAPLLSHLYCIVQRNGDYDYLQQYGRATCTDARIPRIQAWACTFISHTLPGLHPSVSLPSCPFTFFSTLITDLATTVAKQPPTTDDDLFLMEGTIALLDLYCTKFRYNPKADQCSTLYVYERLGDLLPRLITVSATPAYISGYPLVYNSRLSHWFLIFSRIMTPLQTS